MYDVSAFKIRSSLPLPLELRHSSGLSLKFSVNGVDRKELPSTRSDTEDGTWEVDGDMQM